MNSITRVDASRFSFEYMSHPVGGATLFDLSAAHYPDGTNESYMHDPSGNLIDFQDRGGFPWSWTYNGLGEMLSANNPTGGATTFTYDPQGRPETRRDDAGNTTHYTFDSFSRLTQIEWPDGPMRSFAYNEMDQLTTFTDERGKTWSYAYDDDHRLTGKTDPLLHSTLLVWDENDRVSQVIDPLSHATVYGYDADGRLSSVTDRTSHTAGFQYDELSRLTGLANAMSDTWSGSYDADSRLTSWQDPLGHTVILGHDLLDRVTHVTDQVSSPFDFGYDSMGQLRNVTAPLDMSDVLDYDPRGLLTSHRHMTSQVDLERTPLGEVSQVMDPDHNPWPAGYDPQGRPTDAADPLGRTTTYIYDARSRLAHADLPVGAVTFTYDPASRVTECQWLDGTTLTYTYDDANRVTGATGASFAYDEADRMTSSNGLSMGYDFEGRITSETYAPGKVVSYTYDNRGLLTSMSDWVGGMTSFTYDTAERLTGMSRPDGTTVDYTYDAADRLISAVEKQPGPSSGPPLSSITIIRDALGRTASINRSQPLMPVVTALGSTGFAYDPASQITGLSYDGLARLTSDGARSFMWDGASRLIHYAAGADSPSFTYDAYGRMLSRSLGASSEQYVWNCARTRPTLDAVLQGAAARKFYVYTPSGILLYSVDAATGTRRFYHYDEHGNTIFLTSGTGSVTTEYAYTPFGGVSALGATADNPFTWGGAFGVIQLGSTGRAQIGAATYDVSLARAISGDALNSGTGSDSWETGGRLVDGNCDGTLVGSSDASDAWVSRYQSGTWMHEIGHNLRLCHGSPAPIEADPGPINAPYGIFKSVGGLKMETEVVEYTEGGIGDPGIRPVSRNTEPTNISIMNYRYQFEGIRVSDNSDAYTDGGIPVTSGLGELAGNDAIVSIARPSFLPSREPVIRYVAGSSMHEIGHNLGLVHWPGGGGGAGEVDFHEFTVTPKDPVPPDHLWELTEPGMKKPPFTTESIKYVGWVPVFSPGPPWAVLQNAVFRSDGFYRLNTGIVGPVEMPCSWCPP